MYVHWHFPLLCQIGLSFLPHPSPEMAELTDVILSVSWTVCGTKRISKDLQWQAWLATGAHPTPFTCCQIISGKPSCHWNLRHSTTALSHARPLSSHRNTPVFYSLLQATRLGLFGLKAELCLCFFFLCPGACPPKSCRRHSSTDSEVLERMFRPFVFYKVTLKTSPSVLCQKN